MARYGYGYGGHGHGGHAYGGMAMAVTLSEVMATAAMDMAALATAVVDLPGKREGVSRTPDISGTTPLKSIRILVLH